ncbi:hypothetical protein NE237_032350 [Protea cynaroides]|uniref:Uncharacterized protein n=1 Tax=Protea cynaroides TaxID=273540 RepID=A0A9Q0L2X0_9MAGN|nr:hypothetical protein NE237_032350 [Protea cynaroides]
MVLAMFKTDMIHIGSMWGSVIGHDEGAEAYGYPSGQERERERVAKAAAQVAQVREASEGSSHTKAGKVSTLTSTSMPEAIVFKPLSVIIPPPYESLLGR